MTDYIRVNIKQTREHSQCYTECNMHTLHGWLGERMGCIKSIIPPIELNVKQLSESTKTWAIFFFCNNQNKQIRIGNKWSTRYSRPGQIIGKQDTPDKNVQSEISID